MIDLINILGIDPNSLLPISNYEQAVVALDDLKEKAREARKRLAKIHHPDKGGDPEKMKEVNWAVDMIKNAVIPPPQPRVQFVRFTATNNSTTAGSSYYYTTF
ncbi:MAG: hypothetical protein ACXABY_36800 [Candidatus Thorarchaeota archaeon]